MLPLHKRRTQFRYARIEFDLDISHGGPLAGCSFDVNMCLLQSSTRDSDGRPDSGTMSELGNRRRKGTSR